MELDSRRAGFTNSQDKSWELLTERDLMFSLKDHARHGNWEMVEYHMNHLLRFLEILEERAKSC